jgi:hypothetical protein
MSILEDVNEDLHGDEDHGADLARLLASRLDAILAYIHDEPVGDRASRRHIRDIAYGALDE